MVCERDAACLTSEAHTGRNNISYNQKWCVRFGVLVCGVDRNGKNWSINPRSLKNFIHKNIVLATTKLTLILKHIYCVELKKPQTCVCVKRCGVCWMIFWRKWNQSKQFIVVFVVASRLFVFRFLQFLFSLYAQIIHKRKVFFLHLNSFFVGFDLLVYFVAQHKLVFNLFGPKWCFDASVLCFGETQKPIIITK